MCTTGIPDLLAGKGQGRLLPILLDRISAKSCPEVIKTFSCSTQLSMKFIMLIIVDILIFISMVIQHP